MSDIFGQADLRAAARRAPAEAPPSSFSESLRSSWEVTRETGTSMSASGQMYDAYEEYLSEVREHTGKKLPNPWKLDPGRRPKVEALVEKEVRALLEADPTVPFQSPADIRARIGLDRAEIRERRAGVARREFGFAANAGAFLGASGAIMTDPPVLASMFFGAPWATGILRAAVIEATAAGAGEAVAQLGIQGGRRQFGEEPSIGEAATAVGIAAGGAGLLAPVVRGGAAGVRALLKRAKSLPVKGSLTRAAERFLGRQVDLEDASPFPDTPAGHAEHAQRMTEAQVALREGRPVRMSEAPRATVREDISQSQAAMVISDDNLGGPVSASAAAAMRGRAAAGQSLPVSEAPPPPPSREPLARRGLTEEAGDLAEDDALEARVRAMAEAEPNARVTIEDGDTVRSLTTRELVEEIDRDRGFVEQVRACLGGVL